LDFCIARIDEAETVPNTRKEKWGARDASRATLLGEAGQSSESPYRRSSGPVAKFSAHDL